MTVTMPKNVQIIPKLSRAMCPTRYLKEEYHIVIYLKEEYHTVIYLKEEYHIVQ